MGSRGFVRARALAVLCAVAALAVAAPAMAGGKRMYRFVDERGVVHFSDKKAGNGYRAFPLRRGAEQRVRPSSPARYDGLIERAAGRYGVPAAMVKAVIHAESSFDAKAISRAGAMGLMQLMPATARTLGVGAPFNAGENVFGGTRYLKKLYDRYGTWKNTLAAYNAGPTAVDRYDGIPPYAETRAYVERVLSYYRRYHGDFPR